METTKFIKGLGLSVETTNFLLKDNRSDSALINIIKNDDGSVTFDEVNNFYQVKSHTLNEDGQKVYELFAEYRRPKNAIACILKAIESELTIRQSLEKESNHTPADYSDEVKALKDFYDFWAFLTDAQKIEAGKLATEWMLENNIVTTTFDYFFINGTGGLTLENGQIVKFYDPVYGINIHSKIFQASPNGLVSLIDHNKDVYALSAEISQKLEVISEETAPTEDVTALTEIYKNLLEEAEIRKIDKLEKAVVLYDKAKKLAEIAKAKAEKQKIADKATQLKRVTSALAVRKSTRELEALNSIEMTTAEEVEAVVKLVNDKADLLIPAHKREISAKVKEINLALKAKAKADKEAIKNAPEAKAEPVLEEVAPEPAPEPAPAIETPKANKPRRGSKK